MDFQIKPQSYNIDQAVVKVTVVIPNLNSPIVDKTIESIINQNAKVPFEIIVAGMDKYNYIDKFRDLVKIIKTDKPVFPGIARNIGASQAKGELLIFIDSDTIAPQGLINKHLNVHETAEELLIVGGSIEFDSKSYLRLCDNISTFHEYMKHTKDGTRKQVPSANMSISKELFAQFGGFYEKAVGEDSELCARAGIKNVKIVFNSDANVLHYPSRKTMKEILDHAYKFGQFSSRFDHRFNAYYRMPGIIDNGLFLVLAAPALAIILILKMMTFERLPLRYWHTFPILFLTKTVWCYGAAKAQFQKRKGLL